MRESKTINIGNQKYKITQMDAFSFQNWLINAALTVCESRGASDVLKFEGDFEKFGTGLKRLFQEKGLGIFAGLNPDKVESLMQTLLEKCVVRVVDGFEQSMTPNNASGFVDNIKTLFTLEAEAFKINFIRLGLTDGESSTSQNEKTTLQIPRHKHR